MREPIEQMEKAMTVSPDIKLARIKDFLPKIGGVNDDDDLQQRRAMLTVWVQTATSKQLDAVIHFLQTTRIPD
jgi:hypothetical protein